MTTSSDKSSLDVSYTLDLLPSKGYENSTIFVLGATGCGKTTLIANILKDRPRFIVLDTREEYPPDFFGNNVKVCQSFGEYVNALNTPFEKIIVRVPNVDDDSQFVSAVCLHLIDFQKVNKDSLPNVTLAMDEFNRFVSSHSAPYGLREVVERGRGHGIQKIFGAQWFNACPTWARDSFSEIYVFQHSDINGLRMLENFGFAPATVQTLKPYTVLHRRAGSIRHVSLVAKQQTR